MIICSVLLRLSLLLGLWCSGNKQRFMLTVLSDNHFTFSCFLVLMIPDLLSRFQLWNIANDVIRLSHLPQISQLNQMSTLFNLACPNCLTLIARGDHWCRKCRKQINICSIWYEQCCTLFCVSVFVLPVIQLLWLYCLYGYYAGFLASVSTAICIYGVSLPT